MQASMDLSLVSNVVSAFDRQDHQAWTPWDRYAVAHVTLSLMLHDSLQIQIGERDATGLYSLVARKLGNFRVGSGDETILRKSVKTTAAWIEENSERLLGMLGQLKSDENFEGWLDWHRRNDWIDHVNRMHSLVDHNLWQEVGMVLGLRAHDSRRLYEACGNRKLVSHWASATKAPESVVDGFALSALVRGRLYQEIANHKKAQYAFHPMRNYVLGASNQIGACKIPSSARNLAAILVSSAIQERTRDERIASWAENLQVVRSAVQQRDIQFRDSGNAIHDIAFTQKTIKRLGLNVEWKFANKMFEGVDSVVFDLCLGLGIGHFLESTLAGIATFVISTAYRPTRKRIKENVVNNLSLSKWRLDKLSNTGPGRLLLIKQDK